MNTRITSLVGISGGKPEWYTTHRQLVAGERKYGVVWDGAKCEHVQAAPGKLVKAKTGSWGRENGAKISALTKNECVELGLTPGPANY